MEIYSCLCVSTICSFSHVLCIEGGVFSIGMSLCTLSSRMWTLLCGLFVLVSFIKVSGYVCVM